MQVFDGTKNRISPTQYLCANSLVPVLFLLKAEFFPLTFYLIEERLGKFWLLHQLKLLNFNTQAFCHLTFLD